MPLKFTPPNLEGAMRLSGGGKPPPSTGGFRNPLPPPPPGGGLGKLLKLGKFVGIGVGAVADILLNPDPVSDGTIPAWISDVGEQQTISEMCCPFEGGQDPDGLYHIAVKLWAYSRYDTEPSLREYNLISNVAGPIGGFDVQLSGDLQILDIHILNPDGSQNTFTQLNLGNGSRVVPDTWEWIITRQDGQPDTGGDPPPVPRTITTEKTWSAARAQLDTLSTEQWQFTDGFTKLPNFHLPKGGIGFAPLGQTAEKALGKSRTIINFNPQPQSTPNTIFLSSPRLAPDAIPKGNNSNQGLSPPPVGINAPPPATKTLDNNPPPKTSRKTIKYPEPRQTKIDKCAGHCGGGGGTQLSPGSPAANNLTSIVNDLLLQNPLLKKIDATTTDSNGFLKKAWKTTRLSKVLEYLTLAVTLHNAAMLSRNLGASLGDAISAIANNTISLIKNEENQSIDINETLGNTIEGFLKNLLGVDNYDNLTETFSKYNRIVNAASNTIYSILSIQAGLAQGLETIGNYTGRIGNALKKSGAVLENSYSWMSKKVSVKTGRLGQIQAILDTGEGVENFASEIQNATSEFREAQENVNQIGQNMQQIKDEFTEAETEKLEAETRTKTNSQAAQPQLTDFVRDPIK